MPINQSFYASLVCPLTRVKLQPINKELLQTLNEKIAGGSIVNHRDVRVKELFSEGLISIDGKYIYRIDNDIPILLPDEAILWSEP
ncbi:MAG: hypothetical protein DWQ05_01805 [Calditrichaeota bacterium]|nr:MAG: hypothetical protein DWQ05_01805 [Calditrichota bacterium]